MMSGSGKSMKHTLLRAARCAILVEGSLLAALTVRFLWFTRGETPFVLSSYLSSLYFAGRAIRNSLVPTLIVGGIIFVLHEKGRRKRELTDIPRGAIALTAFFASMILVAFLVAGYVTFPRLTWVAAWGVSLLVFFVSEATERLAPSGRRASRRRPAHILVDALAVGGSFVIAYAIRFDGAPGESYQQQMVFLAPFVVALYVGSNYLWDVYSLMWRLTSLRETLIIGQAVGTAATVLLFGRVLLLEQLPVLRIPLGVLLVHPVLTFIGMLTSRAVRRIQQAYLSRRKTVSHRSPNRGVMKVLLVGAGAVGQQLSRELGDHPDFRIAGFLDDDPIKLGRRIAGIRVIGTTEDLAEISREQEIDEVILSMPSAPASSVKRIVSSAEKLKLTALTVPSLQDIVQRKVAIDHLRPVRMEDLLGRTSVDHSMFQADLEEAYQGRAILVTGAAGSIGSELTRQVKEFKPSALLLLDKDENGLYEIELEIREHFDGVLRAIVADIRDRRRLEQIFREHRPEVIFHAAVYKHVPLMELHPSEAVLNNVIGTHNLVELAAVHALRSFVLVSTDKAVNPSSIMGATKRVAEMIVQQTSTTFPDTRFCCVRFGNVLGSRASVIPLFRRQIAQGKNLTVTHPDIQRYFMTIPEAVQLLIQSGSLADQGEVFVLDMGNPVRIVDLARDLIELSGLELGKDIDIDFVGLRPGEKLFEELLTGEENGIRHTSHPKILVAEALETNNIPFDQLLSFLTDAALDGDNGKIPSLLERMGIGYRSTTSVPDPTPVPRGD